VTYIQEEAKRVNCAALEEIFGLGSARLAAKGASSLVSPTSQPPKPQLSPVPEVSLPSAPLPASD